MVPGPERLDALAGELDLPTEALEVVSTVPGVTITGAELRITAHTRLALAPPRSLTLRTVEAGPVGAGGVRWNIYRMKDRLDCFPTLLVRPKGTDLKLRIRTWVRTRGFFGLGATQWISDWQRLTVPLEAAK